MSKLKEKLGKRIKQLRKNAGLTQESLSEIIDIDIPNLSNIERGKRFMTAETLEKFAIALNTTERELFDFSQEEPERYFKIDILKILSSYSDKELKFVYEILESYNKIK